MCLFFMIALNLFWALRTFPPRTVTDGFFGTGIARYEPRIFGFRVHAPAALERWQGRQREDMVDRLKGAGITNVFVEEVGDGEVEMEEGEDGIGE